MAAPPPDKPDGLGVLKSLEKIERGLTKIRTALQGTPKVKIALAEAKILKRVLSDATRDALKVQKQMTGIINKLQKGWVGKKKKSGGGGNK